MRRNETKKKSGKHEVGHSGPFCTATRLAERRLELGENGRPMRPKKEKNEDILLRNLFQKCSFQMIQKMKFERQLLDVDVPKESIQD